MSILRSKLKEFKDLGPKKFLAENQIYFIIFAIFMVAFGLRIYSLGTVPGGFAEAERSTVETLRQLRINNLWLKDGYYNAAYIYTAYLWSKIFGLTVLSLRFLSALIGGTTVVLAYVFISEWFSRKIAIFMALLFAISSFHISVSRLIIPEIFLPFILLALFIALTRAYRTKNIWLFGLAGLLMGIGLYSSPAFILVPFLFAISGLYFYKKNKKFLLSYKIEVVTALLAFASVSIPYVASFVFTPQTYLGYYGFSTSVMHVVTNFSQVFTTLFVTSPTNFFINVGSEPLLDPLIYISSLFGFLFAVISVSRRKYFFLIGWLAFFWLYAALKRELQPGDYLGLLPVLYTLSALIIDYVLDRWFETFPLNKRLQTLAIGLISIFFALSMLYNFNRYFVAYKNSPLVDKEFSAALEIPLK